MPVNYAHVFKANNFRTATLQAMNGDKCVGAIVCKLDMHKKMVRRGYIAMLAIDSEFRRKKIGKFFF